MAEIIRGDVVFPEERIAEIIQGIPQQSAVLGLARKLRNMSRGQTNMAVMSEFPEAGFVNGDTGLKPSTRMAWENVMLTAEELAAVVAVPENVLDDSDYDIWEEVRPRIVEAMGKAIDLAVIFGTNKPPSWPAALVAGATSASHAVALDEAPDLYDAIMSEGGVIAKVEEDGFAVNGHVGALQLRAKLRALRTTDGLPIFTTNIQDAQRYALDGEPIAFPVNGGFDAAQALLVSGDWNQLVWAMRTDLQVKLSTDAVMQDPAGNVTLNAFQQDSVLMRFKMRLGFALPNPTSLVNPDGSTRYPFSILTAS